jgi:7-cyano-7-deazaguanine synthase in queuosine biosynthesis
MIDLGYLKFDITTYPKNIAILCSGGSDSVLLLYLILLDIEKTKTNHSLSIYIVDRYNNPLEHADRIINLISKKFNKKLELINLKIPKVTQRYEVPVSSSILGLRHEVVLWGINKYPRDETIRPNHLFSFQETDKRKFPFSNLEKDKLIQAFYDLDIQDILYQTHSCGSNLSRPCGICFNCKERAWAFEQLKMDINLGI